MALPKEELFSSGDYWDLPDGKRAELIDGQLYDMAPPSRVHQELVMELSAVIRNYIREKGGSCKVYPSPFAVDLNADDETYVEPDISVICDRGKLTDKGCKGAPDFIIEVVSPGSRKMDYSTKNALYFDAGVREYWIVDPAKRRTTVYRYEEDAAPMVIPFDLAITVGIYGDLQIVVEELLQ
ncbi:MAG: Uma2 family endonuclease [Lachnospiraceae bacterium]|nr:Uma2 family endonuclease [Lachnospiraceae bacterium]